MSNIKTVFSKINTNDSREIAMKKIGEALDGIDDMSDEEKLNEELKISLLFDARDLMEHHFNRIQNTQALDVFDKISTCIGAGVLSAAPLISTLKFITKKMIPDLIKIGDGDLAKTIAVACYQNVSDLNKILTELTKELKNASK